jgi:hypothetical protein
LVKTARVRPMTWLHAQETPGATYGRGTQ